MPREFHTELDDLNHEFTATATLVVRALTDLVGYPPSTGKPAPNPTSQILAEVPERCRILEERGHVLLARQAPVGGDLRRLIAILRLLTNIERAASHTRHVMDGRDTLDVEALPTGIDELISAMGRRSAEVFESGLDAWRTGDALAIIELDEQDQDVDALQLQLLEAANHSDQIHGATRLALGLVARHYERIADYGVTLARDTAFVVTGDRVTT